MTSRYNRRKFLQRIGATGVGIGIAGCSGDGSDGGDGTTDSGGGSTSGSTASDGPLFDLDAIDPKGLVGQGPNGTEASPPKSVALSDSEVSEVKNQEFNVEIVFHYKGDTWVRLQREAIKKRAGELGMNITGIHYPDFSPEKQSNVLQTVAEKDNVDGVFSIPTDTAATTDAYQAVLDAGKELVFMDNVPEGFQHPSDYAGLVAADNRGMGTIGGRMMTELVDSGKIIFLTYDVPFYVVDERETGAKQVLEESGNYQLEQYGFTDTGKVLQVAQDALTANPDAAGLWAPWVDAPGAQAIQAIRQQSADIPVTSCDLGTRSAVLMAERSPLKGVGSQQPYAQGLTEVDMMAKAFLGKETPPYIGLPSPPVARQNLLEMYPKILKEEPPEKVTKHFE
ncbi:substrate-binding domain-containing protein [Halomicroarcula limicola]|uniref:Substrate-binding domain-containing protein n=1 Tax=Haloarcula limicola TaxID=1429915 RepID=A0A8J7YDU8_9EURY|nr:substrate-binding domain-containing protein [Halomicroarcula limicola]MBV0926424.1 substrate-binding domain-containing protein [Halomicroarcula limicola]